MKSVCAGSGDHAVSPRLPPLQKVVTWRVVNCYYSNLIEGHKTAPREIERALKRYFQFQALHLQRYREELLRIVRALVDEGEIPRARV